MTKVKLCGLQSVQDVLAAKTAQADYIGFVLAKSKREVTAQEVNQYLAPLRSEHEVNPTPVLVLVNRTEEEIAFLCSVTGVTHVQLCGEESQELCSRLGTLHGLHVWKTWSVRGSREDDMLSVYGDHVDAVLLDTYQFATHGGTGHPFQWDSISRIKTMIPSTPLIIAGGLTPLTVGSLVAQYHPFAVDVSSGIETAGKKDPEKMNAFVEAARSGSHVS